MFFFLPVHSKLTTMYTSRYTAFRIDGRLSMAEMFWRVQVFYEHVWEKLEYTYFHVTYSNHAIYLLKLLTICRMHEKFPLWRLTHICENQLVFTQKFASQYVFPSPTRLPAWISLWDAIGRCYSQRHCCNGIESWPFIEGHSILHKRRDQFVSVRSVIPYWAKIFLDSIKWPWLLQPPE